MELNFDKLFISLIFPMKINLTYPYIPKDRKWALKFLIPHGIYTSGFILLIYTIITLDLPNKHYSQACKNGILSTVYIINTFHYGILTKYQELLKSLMQDMKKDYESKIPSEILIMKRYASQGSKFCNLWLTIVICSFFTFPIKYIVLTVYFCKGNGCRLVHLYEATYPSPIEEYKNNIFAYIFLNAYFLYNSVLSALIYLAFIPLIPVFTLHACGQFAIVKQNIDNLFENSTRSEVQDKLKNIVMQLQYIYSFVDRIKECFKEAIEFTLKSVPVFLPVTYYGLTESYRQGELSVEFFAFIIGATFICVSWCYYSDLLMEKGDDIGLAAYSCGWESCYDRRARTTLVLVMMRVQCPVALRSMFCNVCLDTVTDIFHQSYAILNLMNAVMD